MAGYYNSLKFDTAYADAQVYEDQTIGDYVLNLKASYRQGETPALPAGVVGQPTFYGPMRGSLVTQESFLQGRGQTLCRGPDCDVLWLPESLFPAQTTYNQQPTCERTDLEPLQTRMKRSCNGLEETDTSEYWMMPGAFQTGYSGPYFGIGGNLQTRSAPVDGTIAQGAESYGNCRQNYGTYGNSRSFAPYSN
jgi:hypothetical protein